MKLHRTLLAVASAMAVTAAPVLAEELRIGTAIEPLSIDPHFWGGMPNVGLARHFFDHLIKRDKTQQFQPGLAVSWGALNDTTWEFKLRKDVKWHDGSPVTADDVLFTVERIKDPNLKTIAGGYSRFVLGKELIKIDDHTIHVKTAKPYPLMIEDMANFPVVSSKHAAGAKAEDFNSGKAAVGTGPYRFVEWVPGDQIVMEANANYWGGKPNWDRVILKPIKANPSRIAALLSGDVDLIDKVATTDIAGLKKEPKVVIHQSVSNRVIYLHIDSNRHVSPFVKSNDGTLMFPNPLRDQRVRKALSKAINREAIVERVMEGAAKPASQLVPHFVFGFNPALKPEPYDPEGARRLLAKAGYGEGFRLTIHGPNDRYINDAKIVETVAAMWTRVGVRTDVVTQPVSVYSPRATKLSFSVVLYGYGAEAAEASSPLKAVLHTVSKPAGYCCSNRGRFSNVLFDDKLEQSYLTVDRAAREKLLQEAMAIAMKEVGIIPLHSQVNTWATRKGLVYEARSDETTLAQSTSKAN